MNVLTDFFLWIRYAKSLSILLEGGDSDFESEMKIILNKKDKLNNTPLHYATIRARGHQGILHNQKNEFLSFTF